MHILLPIRWSRGTEGSIQEMHFKNNQQTTCKKFSAIIYKKIHNIIHNAQNA